LHIQILPLFDEFEKGLTLDINSKTEGGNLFAEKSEKNFHSKPGGKKSRFVLNKKKENRNDERRGGKVT